MCVCVCVCVCLSRALVVAFVSPCCCRRSLVASVVSLVCLFESLCLSWRSGGLHGAADLMGLEMVVM